VSSVSSLFRSLGFPTGVLLHFIGELESRRFGLGPLSGGLPSLVRGVGSRLDRFLRRHDTRIRLEVVGDGGFDERSFEVESPPIYTTYPREELLLKTAMMSLPLCVAPAQGTAEQKSSHVHDVTHVKRSNNEAGGGNDARCV